MYSAFQRALVVRFVAMGQQNLGAEGLISTRSMRVDSRELEIP